MLEELFTPEYEKLVKKCETSYYYRHLTEQECRFAGSSHPDKYVTDHYTVLGHLRTKMPIERIRKKRKEFKYSIAYIGNFRIPEDEMQRLCNLNRLFVLIDLKPIDERGRTIADPDVIDEHEKIVKVARKQREDVLWRIIGIK